LLSFLPNTCLSSFFSTVRSAISTTSANAVPMSADPAQSSGHAGRRGHPDARCGREAPNLMLGSQLENRPAAEKADSRDDALNDARNIGGAHAGFRSADHEDRRAQGDQHVSSQAGRMMRELALQADHGPNE
jgi:hypothetical protein